MKQPVSKSALRNAMILIGRPLSVALMVLVGYGAFTASTSTASRDSIIPQTGKAQKKSPLPQATNAQFSSMPNAPSAVTITATMTDNVTPNTTKILPGSTINYTVTISSTGTTDAAAVAFNDVIDSNTTLVAGSVHASPVAANETYNWVGNTFLDSSVRGLPSVLANDTISSAPDTIVLTTLSGAATTLGGSVTLGANGHFMYTPPLGRPNVADGASVNDSFIYTIRNSVDATLTATGTVTINLSGRVWYLQAGASGDGRSGTPSGSPSAMSTAADKSTDIFYIFSNAGSLNGLFSLDAGQILLGQGVNLIVNTITLFTAAAPTPTTTNTTGNGVTLAGAPGNNTISGFNIGNCSGTAIFGSNVGTLGASVLSINTTGAGLDLTGVSTPTVSVVLGGLTSTGGAKNVNLVGLNGTINLAGGTLSGATGNALDVSGGSAAVTFTGGISNSGGRQVNIINRTGGTVALSGAIGGTGTGIFLNANPGATINFTGGINLSTGANAAFTATGPGPAATSGGTVNVTQNNTTIVNTLTSAAGTALNVANTTIGGSGLTFRSISSNGAVNGIVLNNTGAGTLTVSGNAGSCTSIADCTGGVIQNSTNHAISLTSTISPSFTRIAIQNAARSGIDGQQVTNFTLANSFINNVGTAAAGQHDESNISFNDNGLFTTTTLSGVVSITNNTLTNARRHGIQIENGSGTISSLTISNNILTSSPLGTVSLGSAILVLQQGSAAATSHLTTGTINANNITNFPSGEGIAILGGSGNSGNNTSATLGANGTPINITNNKISGQAAAGQHTGSNAIRASMNSQVGVMNVNISCNGNPTAPCSAPGSITNVEGQTVSAFAGGSITGTTTIDNNVSVLNHTIAAGTAGIAVQVDDGPAGAGTSAANYNFNVTNNKISQYDGFGIRAIARASLGKMDVTIQNNQVGSTIQLTNRNAIRVDSGSAVGDVNTCLNMTGNAGVGGSPNKLTGSGVNAGIGLRKQGAVATTNDFGIVGISPANPTNAQVQAFVGGNNLSNDGPGGSGSLNGVDVLSGSMYVACTQTAAPTKEDAGDGSSMASQHSDLRGDKSPKPASVPDTISSSDDVVRSSTKTTASVDRGLHQQHESLVRYAALRTNSPSIPHHLTSLPGNFDTALAVFKNSDTSRGNLKLVNYPVIATTQKKTLPNAPQTTVTQNIPVLPAGKSVTIKFTVTVNNPPAAAQVSTQGTVTATGISNVLTDDPDTGTASDPTVTLVDLTITWTGATDTNWNTGSNWNTTLAPVAINDVLIPTAGVTNNPTISASDVTVNTLTQQSGRTLTMSSGRTLNVAGNWTNNGNLTAGDGTVVFNGANNTQTLAGSTTFNNLTINHTGTGNVTATGSTLAVGNLLRVQAGTLISSSTFKDVQIDSGATLQSDGSTMNVSGNWTNNGGTFTPGAGTVVFNSTTAGQTIGGTATSQSFNIVQVNKTGQTLTVGGSTTTLTLNGALTLTAGTFDKGTAATINAAGNWTNNGGTFTPGTGTVVFNSTTAAQAINGTAVTQTFNNLTVNKTGQTLSVAGSTTTLNINGNFLLTAGTFDKGTAATINVGGDWTKNAGTFTQGTGTVVFNGSIPQTIGGPSPTTFNNLTINNAAGVTLSAAETYTGTLTLTLGVLTNGANLTLGNGATISRSGGSLSAAPTFGATVNVIYTGSLPITTGPEIPTSTTALSNLTINDSGGVTLNANASVNVLLTLTAGDLKTGPTGTEFTLTMPAAATSGPATNATDVVGNVKRTGFVSAGTALSFGNPFNTIRINSGTAPTDITVNLVKAVPTTPTPFAGAIARKYTITPTGGSGISATLRLHYLDTELNGNTEGATLNLFRFDGTNWHKEGQTSNDTANNWVEKNNVAQFSPWTMNSSVPTDVRLDAFSATGYDGGALIEWRTGFEVDNLGFNLYRDEGGKRTPINQQIVAGSALVAGSGISISAGQSYAFWDTAVSKSTAQYWLESIDLNGQSDWHGPFSSSFIGGNAPARGNSSMLGRTENAQVGLTNPVERAALPQSVKPEQIAIQSGLAGQSAVKMWVKRAGFYRVTAAELAAAGLDPGVDTRLLQMYVDGQQIPINVISDTDDLLTAVEFYGRGLDAAFTDQRVYWLVSGSAPGLRIKQVKGAGQPAASQSFLHTVERRDRTIYFSGLRNGEQENFFGPVIAATPVDQSLTIQHLDQSASGTATIEVALQGVTTLPHRVWIYVNGTFAGEAAFEGQTATVSKFNVALSLLRSGDNQVRLVAQAGPTDITLVDHIQLSYWHTFTADDNALRLTTPGNQQLTITGFSSEAIRVLDVTDPEAPQELATKIEEQKTGFAVTTASPEAGERRLLATTDDQPGKPVKIAANRPSSLRSPSHAADLVIIAQRDFFPAIEPLRSLRSNQGLKIELADVDDAFDEFSFGTKSPQALKDFLLYAATTWKVKPRYVLFVGDASYDSKNYLGLGDSDLVPTKLIDTGLMETASDDALADFNADGIADLAVGRLAARTPAEASVMVRKILGYESSEPLESMLLVADLNNGFDFESASTELRALIPGNLRVEQINRGQVGDATAKGQLIDGIMRGQKIVNYMGHGSVNLWSGSLLTNEDARNLANGERLPVFVMMTCLNGYFHDPALDSLAESLLKAENGGAVAVWTSTGMTTPLDQAVLNKQLYQLLFATGNAMTLGEATARAKAAVTDGDIRRTWILLGDPTMRLK